MDQNCVEKNVVYQENVLKIAKYLNNAFYQEDTLEPSFPADPDQEQVKIGMLLGKAETIYKFFESAEDAKKALRFLHTVSPVKAKEIIDAM